MKVFETIEVDNEAPSCDGGGGALGHPRVYLTMAGIMAGAALVSVVMLPAVNSASKPLDSDPGKELTGFVAMLAGFAGGWFAARFLMIGLGMNPDDPNKWLQLLFILTAPQPIQDRCDRGSGSLRDLHAHSLKAFTQARPLPRL